MKLTFTPTEVGQLLGLGRNSTYEALRRGQIRSVGIGKKILIPRTEIDRILQSLGPQNGRQPDSGTTHPSD